MTNLAAAVDMADCCRLQSCLASQGSSRSLVWAGYSYTSASMAVFQARMLCCSCPIVPTDSSGNYL